MTDSMAQIDQQELVEQLLKEIHLVATKLQPRVASSQPVTLDSQLDRDLGFDSLGRVELIAHLERSFSVHLPDRTFSDAETARDLLRGLMTARHASPLDLQRIELIHSDNAETPAEARTLLEVLDWHAARHPGFNHIRLLSDEHQDVIISYGQLQQRAQQAAAGLQSNGLMPGDTVALMLPTGEDYFYSFFAVLYAGAVPVPIYPPVRLNQLEDHMRRQVAILDNARCRFLVTVKEAKPLAWLLKSQIDCLKELLTLDELAASKGAYSRPQLNPDDTAFVQYTSGSTGNPKGVVLSHFNLLSNIRVDGSSIDVTADDVFVSWLPLYHDMGLIGAWLGSLYFSVPLIIMSPLTFLARPVRWLQALHRFGGTLSAAPNFAYELCLNRIDDDDLNGLDLSSWRIAMNGAEAVSPDTIRSFSKRFAPYGFRAESMFPVYGLAECSVGLAFPSLNQKPRIDRVRREVFSLSGRAEPALPNEGSVLRFVGCGHALSGHQIRIVDSSSQELPERHQGRLQFRGPSATSGYYRNPQATGKLFDGDWLETGDLAYQADGELYLTGRSKDVIIRGGRNIYPHELEQAVGEIEGIRTGRVAVFAVLDEARQTEKLVVLAETRESDADVRSSLVQRIAESTAELTMIAADDIVLAPPGSVLKTSSGKIRRAACSELYQQGRIGEVAHSPWLQLARLQLSALPKQLQRLIVDLVKTAYALYAQLVFRVLAVWVALGVLLLPGKTIRWGLLRFSARLFAGLTATGLQVTGRENLPPVIQNCIYVVNHASYIDVYAIIAALPRRFRFVAKAELSQKWLPRNFLSRIGTLFVERFDRAAGIDALRTMEKAALDGDSLLFFPEGTFTHAPGLRPFRMGAFVAAVDSGLPVVPVAIRGSRSILPGNSWFAHRGDISVTIGEAIDPPALRAETDSDWDLALKVKELAREQILRHCGEPDMGHEQAFPPKST